jgi:arylsulfatase A-like enzyme
MRGILASLTAGAALAVCGASEARPKNIVLILADDLGWGDVSCYGATAVATPRVDRLAREGVRFTDAHAPASVCTPTRYAIMTGEYAWRRKGTGIAPGDAALLIEPGRTTLPSVLKRAGYVTGAVGKWHLGLGPGPGKTDWNTEIVPGPREIGFDYSFLVPPPAIGCRAFTLRTSASRASTRDPIRVNYNLDGPNYPGELDGRANRDQLKLDWDYGHNYAVINGIGRIGYMTGGRKARWVDEDMADTLAAKGVAFIERNRDRPFFLYFATHDIHVPRVPNPRFVGTTSMGARGDAIVQFDYQVGAILDALDRFGLAEDTLVVLSSDNGPVLNDGYRDRAVEALGAHRPAGDFRGHKYSAFEGGTRVPFLVRWPARVRAGGVSSALVSLVDWVATAAALTGQTLAAADAPDSFDVSAALLDASAQGRNTLISQDPALSLREGKWKFIPAWTGKRDGGHASSELGLLGDPDAFVKGGRDDGRWDVDQLYDTQPIRARRTTWRDVFPNAWRRCARSCSGRGPEAARAPDRLPEFLMVAVDRSGGFGYLTLTMRSLLNTTVALTVLLVTERVTPVLVNERHSADS